MFFLPSKIKSKPIFSDVLSILLNKIDVFVVQFERVKLIEEFLGV